MLRNTIAALPAAAVSLLLGSGIPAFSQAQLEAEVLDKLTALGFTTEQVSAMSEEQVLEVKNIVDTTDDDETKRWRSRIF